MALRTRNVKGQLANSASTLLTADLNQTIIIQNVTIANASGISQPGIKFYIVPLSGSASNANQVSFTSSILDDDQIQLSIKHNLFNGDFLAAEATNATAVNFFVSYVQRTD